MAHLELARAIAKDYYSTIRVLQATSIVVNGVLAEIICPNLSIRWTADNSRSCSSHVSGGLFGNGGVDVDSGATDWLLGIILNNWTVKVVSLGIFTVKSSIRRVSALDRIESHLGWL